MVQKRKTYDTAFKRQAVELTKTRKYVSELARELGIQPQLLYKWRREYDALGEGSFPGNGNLKLTPEQEKIHELEKKLTYLSDHGQHSKPAVRANRTFRVMGVRYYLHPRKRRLSLLNNDNGSA